MSVLVLSSLSAVKIQGGIGKVGGGGAVRSSGAALFLMNVSNPSACSGVPRPDEAQLFAEHVFGPGMFLAGRTRAGYQNEKQNRARLGLDLADGQGRGQGRERARAAQRSRPLKSEGKRGPQLRPTAQASPARCVVGGWHRPRGKLGQFEVVKRVLTGLFVQIRTEPVPTSRY